MGELREKAGSNSTALYLLKQVENAVELHSNELPNTAIKRSLSEELSDIWTCYYFLDHYDDSFGKYFQGVIDAARDRFGSAK